MKKTEKKSLKHDFNNKNYISFKYVYMYVHDKTYLSIYFYLLPLCSLVSFIGTKYLYLYFSYL